MMKRILCLAVAALALAFSAAAQNGAPVKVYGVDFTSVKVYAASETPADFRQAFDGINRLLMSEPDKYKFTKMLGGPSTLDVKMLIDLNAAHDFSQQIPVYDNGLPQVDLQEKVRSYPLPDSEGTGLVIVALQLDKSRSKATMVAVLFDIATREILADRMYCGKAGGFGLRNFWANPVNMMLRKCSFL